MAPATAAQKPARKPRWMTRGNWWKTQIAQAPNTYEEYLCAERWLRSEIKRYRKRHGDAGGDQLERHLAIQLANIAEGLPRRQPPKP